MVKMIAAERAVDQQRELRNNNQQVEDGNQQQQLAFFARPSTLWLLFHITFLFNITAELVFGVWAATFADVSGLVPSADAPMVAATFYWCYTSFRSERDGEQQLALRRRHHCCLLSSVCPVRWMPWSVLV